MAGASGVQTCCCGGPAADACVVTGATCRYIYSGEHQCMVRIEPNCNYTSSYRGFSCWRILLWLHSFSLGLYTVVKGFGRDQASGIEMHRCWD